MTFSVGDMTTPTLPRLEAARGGEVVTADAVTLLRVSRDAYRWAQRVLVSTGPMELGPTVTREIAAWIAPIPPACTRTIRVLARGEGGTLEVEAAGASASQVMPGSEGDVFFDLEVFAGGGFFPLVLRNLSGSATMDLARVMVMEGPGAFPVPIPYTGYCYPTEIGAEIAPGVDLSGTVMDSADEREDRIMMALAFDSEIPPP